MNNQGLVFKLFDIPIEIKSSFLLLGLFLYTWINDVGGALELTIWAGLALLLHELGHAWALQRYGHLPRIELHMLGGMAYSRSGDREELTNGQNIIIVLAGPAMSILMGVILLGIIVVAGGLPHVFLTEEQARLFPLFFSFGWGFLNLVPIFPLDGGQFLRYVLAYNPRWNAELIAIIVGLVLGGAAIIYTLSTGQIWNSMIIGLLLMTNVNRLRAIRDQGQHPKIIEITQLTQQNRLGEALSELKNLIPQLNSGQHKAWAYHLAAHIIIQDKRMEEAATFIKEFPEYETYIPELKLKLIYHQEGQEQALAYAKKAFALKPTQSLALAWIQLLVQSKRFKEIPEVLSLMRTTRFHTEIANYAAQALIEAGAFDISIMISQNLFKKHKDGTYAYNVACALARSDRAEEAINWLRQAIGAGYDNLNHIRTDKDLTSIRSHPDFEELLESLT